MELLFVEKRGQSYEGELIYEFLFSTSTTDLTDESWLIVPANGNVTVPIDYVEEKRILSTEIKFDLVQNSNRFSYFDAIEGVIAITWENIDNYLEEEIPKDRLIFKYGDTMETVIEKLSLRDLDFNET